MRVRTRKKLKRKNTAIVLLFLLPLIGFGAFAGFLIYILDDIASFTFLMDPPDTDYFYSEDEIDDDVLLSQAHYYERQMETFHMNGTGIPIDITYTDDDYDEVEEWGGTDNGALHLGFTTAAECHRYKWALDNDEDEELENATRMVKKLVKAWSMMLAAPNGGIGPDYPGTPARFVSAPEDREYHEWMFEEHERHFNGTGEYHNWRVRLYTSRDELAGYYLGFSSVLSCIDPDGDSDSKWCYERIQLLVEQMIEGFRDTNWLVLHGDGTPCGSDLNPHFEGSTWQLALLRIGATARPDKYDSLYQYCCAKIMSMEGAIMGSPWNVIESTYALSFGMAVMYSLVILEDNDELQYHYIKNFETRFYNYVKYHRNAFYNMVHLVFMDLLDKNQREQFKNDEYDDDDVVWDVKDQLWRFHVSGWAEGVRNYNLTQRPHSTRSTSLNPEIAKKERVPSKKEWRTFFTDSPFGQLFSWIGVEFDFGEDSEEYMLPLTVSEYDVHHWVWEHSKFEGEGGSPNGNGLHEAAPNGYLTIYWIGRAYDIF